MTRTKRFDPNEPLDDKEDPFSVLGADLDNLDDETDDLLGDAPIRGSQRQPVRTVEEFDALVDENIKRLQSKKGDAKARIEAAYWLGESGAPKAITALAVAYRNKKNRALHKAAAYALGQFKALDEAIERRPDEPVVEALSRPENAWVVELLNDIVMYDERGRRKRISTGSLLALLLVLLLTLGGMVAAYVVLPAPGDAPPTPVAGLTAPQTLDFLRQRVPEAQQSAEALAARLAPDALDCADLPAAPASLQTEQSAYPVLAGLVVQYNQALAQLEAARAIITDACTPTEGEDTTAPALSEAQRAQANNAVDSAALTLTLLSENFEAAQAELDSAATATTEAAATASAATSTAEAAAPPAATPIPDEPAAPPTETPEPTATLGLTRQQLSTQIGALYLLIDDATGTRGHTALLAQYWRDVRDSGRLDGCLVTTPPIPADYTLPPDIAPLAPQALRDAAEQINTGLALSRSGWDFFKAVCVNGTVTQQVQTGLDTTAAATSLYAFAAQLLRTLE